jgi:hypothetical protein
VCILSTSVDCYLLVLLFVSCAHPFPLHPILKLTIIVGMKQPETAEAGAARLGRGSYMATVGQETGRAQKAVERVPRGLESESRFGKLLAR